MANIQQIAKNSLLTGMVAAAWTLNTAIFFSFPHLSILANLVLIPLAFMLTCLIISALGLGSKKDFWTVTSTAFSIMITIMSLATIIMSPALMPAVLAFNKALIVGSICSTLTFGLSFLIAMIRGDSFGPRSNDTSIEVMTPALARQYLASPAPTPTFAPPDAVRNAELRSALLGKKGEPVETSPVGTSYQSGEEPTEAPTNRPN